MSDDVKSKRAPARSAAQKAQDNLDAARKRLERAKGNVTRLDRVARDAVNASNAATEEVQAAQAAVKYAAQNPDLGHTRTDNADGSVSFS